MRYELEKFNIKKLSLYVKHDPTSLVLNGKYLLILINLCLKLIIFFV